MLIARWGSRLLYLNHACEDTQGSSISPAEEGASLLQNRCYINPLPVEDYWVAGSRAFIYPPHTDALAALPLGASSEASFPPHLQVTQRGVLHAAASENDPRPPALAAPRRSRAVGAMPQAWPRSPRATDSAQRGCSSAGGVSPLPPRLTEPSPAPAGPGPLTPCSPSPPLAPRPPPGPAPAGVTPLAPPP